MITFFLISAIILSVVFICLLRPIAFKLKLVDEPNHRKLHANATPLIGGIAIFLAFMLVVLMLPISLLPYRTLLLGMSILIIVGILDDFYDISPKLRLLIQIFCAALIVFPGHMVLGHWGYIFSASKPFMLPFPIAAIFTILFVVGFLNATNMLDGQDGLVGGICIVELLGFVYICYKLAIAHALAMQLVMIGCLLGFLIFNFRGFGRKQAAVFLGDNGSTLLGYFIAWFAVYLSQDSMNADQFPPVLFLWILAYPVFDMIGSIIRRLIYKQSPLRPDRGHFHHLLHRIGIRVEFSSPILYLFSIVLSMAGFLLLQYGVSQQVSFIIYITVMIAFAVLLTCYHPKD